LRHQRQCDVPSSGSLRRSHSQGRGSSNSPGRTADHLRAGGQSQDRESARSHHSPDARRPRRRGDRMNRRELIILLGGAVFVWPRLAHTQPAVPRVGYVWAGERGTEGSGLGGLRQGLADLGYVVGRNLVFEERYANGNSERVAPLIDELLALNVDVLVTPG